MKAYKNTTENWIYGLAFLLALGLRLFQLGAGPLSDTEAGWALQALGLAHAGKVVMGAQPAYILITSQLFYIFDDTNFLARVFPALAGSLIIWLPFCFRRWMGDSSWLHRAGLIMAFGLAIDPGLVSISRQAGSLMPAMSFSLLALAFLYNRRMVLAGIFIGFAVLSGPAFIQGLLILGLSWFFFQFANRRFNQPPPEDESAEPSLEPISSRSIGIGLAALLGTLLAVGTLFLQYPQGLAALAETILAYIDALIKPSGIPALRLPLSIFVYQTLLLIFAIVSVVHVWIGTQADRRTRQMVVGLSIWTVVALCLPLLYAGRQVSDVAWALVPLWALAAIEISRLLITDQDDMLSRLVTAGLGFLIVVLAVVSWINLLSIGRYQVNVAVYWAIIIGAFLLGFIAMLLVASVWSTSAARLGVVWGLCFILGIQLISNTWGMVIVRQNGAQDLWPILATTGQADQFNQTLSDLSSRNTGLRDQMEIVSLVDTPSLRWNLRQFPNSRFGTTLSASESPPVVITQKGADIPSLAENYRGQDFNWRLYPAWKGVLPPDLINWLAFRQAPLSQEQIILWARSDMFPGGTLGASESTVP